MLTLWWPAFIVPALMVLSGFLGGHVKGLHYPGVRGTLDEERQRFADNQLWHMLRPFGAAYGAIAFMVMRSVRLVPEEIQFWLVAVVMVLEIGGVLLMALPIERALQQQFEEENTNEGEL